MTHKTKNSRLSARAILCQILGMLMALTVALPSAAGDAKSVHAEVKNSVVAVEWETDDDGAEGSGVIVGKDVIVTNFHVIDGAGEADIQIWQAKDEHATEWHPPIKAKIAWCKERQDLCLLYVPGVLDRSDAKIATMGEANALSIGDEVYTFGNPEGYQLSLTRGIVSKLNYNEKHPAFEAYEFDFGPINAPIVQTDADILGGSSGGGLFNDDGELIGITTFTDHGEREIDKTELSFAMPVELVAELLAAGSLDAKEEYAAALAGALRHHAQKGNVQAQFDLGWLYDEMSENAGIPHKKLTDGERWFLGKIDDESLEWLFPEFADMKAAEWYKRAAESGHVRAQYNLAISYDIGIGAEDGDKAAAAYWFKRVFDAEEDYGLWPVAARYLGWYYENGQAEIERGEDMTAEDFFNAAARGLLAFAKEYNLDAEEQYYLAELYREGRGVEQNSSKAYSWFLVSAENGDEDAAGAAEEMRANGSGFDIRDAQAEAETYIAESYIARAERGELNAEGQYYLGGLYKEGKGVEQSDYRAYVWFFIAAINGHESADAEVVEMHKEYGADSIREAQAEAAVYLAEQSATDGEAYLWIFVAAESGNEDAAVMVEEMREEYDGEVVRELQAAAETFLKEVNSGE